MSYDPDPGAEPSGYSFIAWLSQRDLSVRVPVNFVSQPAIVVAPACFAHNVYEEAAAAKCFSNILAIGFRKIEIDLYWDVTRRVWSFCPVQLGNADAIPPATEGTSSPVVSPTSASLGSAKLTGRAPALETPGNNILMRRADPESLSVPTPEASSSKPVSSSVSSTVTIGPGGANSKPTGTTSDLVSLPSSAGDALIKVGPYACSKDVNLGLLTNVLAEHLLDTENVLNATTKYLIINLHAAATASDPTGSAPQPESGFLPTVPSSLSTIISQQLSAYLYKPDTLIAQRADLNSSDSWFSVLPYEQPDVSYFELDDTDNGYSTPDGWPSESFIELQNTKRLLTTYGRVDPQMKEYNFGFDQNTIFPEGYLQYVHDVKISGGGEVTSGCFYQSSEESLAELNSSWAYETIGLAGNQAIMHEAGNLTYCGISPELNSTLGNKTVDEEYGPYKDFISSAIWAWSEDQPRNVTGTSDDDDFRCAALNIRTGRLEVADCTVNHNGACRVDNKPYSWGISGSQGQYMDVNKACNGDSEFSVPQTAVEARYVMAAWKEARSDYPNNDVARDDLLWVNFNNVDTSACWVVGQNSRCPYLQHVGEDQRTVVVPTVAAVIVFVLAALTLFVKCAANRTNSHRGRRRAADGWDYEGVPS